MRGHWLTTTGRRLEDASIDDFLDISYAYGINSPELRYNMRSMLLGYSFDFSETPDEEDTTFEGFQKAALSPSMLDELDSFGLG